MNTLENLKLLSLTETAEKLNLSERTIRRYVKSGKLSALYTGQGSKMQFPEEEILRFINDNLERKDE